MVNCNKPTCNSCGPSRPTQKIKIKKPFKTVTKKQDCCTIRFKNNTPNVKVTRNPCVEAKQKLEPMKCLVLEGADSRTGMKTSGPVTIQNGDIVRFWSESLDILVEEGSGLINIENNGGGVGPTGPAGITCDDPDTFAVYISDGEFQNNPQGGFNGQGTFKSFNIKVCKMACSNDAFTMVNITIPSDGDISLDNGGIEHLAVYSDVTDTENLIAFTLDSDCRPTCTLRFPYKYTDEAGALTGHVEISTTGEIAIYPEHDGMSGEFPVDTILWCNSFTYCVSPIED